MVPGDVTDSVTQKVDIGKSTYIRIVCWLEYQLLQVPQITDANYEAFKTLRWTP